MPEEVEGDAFRCSQGISAPFQQFFSYFSAIRLGHYLCENEQTDMRTRVALNCEQVANCRAPQSAVANRSDKHWRIGVRTNLVVLAFGHGLRLAVVVTLRTTRYVFKWRRHRWASLVWATSRAECEFADSDGRLLLKRTTTRFQRTVRAAVVAVKVGLELMPGDPITARTNFNDVQRLDVIAFESTAETGAPAEMQLKRVGLCRTSKSTARWRSVDRWRNASEEHAAVR